MRLRLIAILALMAALIGLAPPAAAQPSQVHASLDGEGVTIAWARAGEGGSATQDKLQWWTEDGLDGPPQELQGRPTVVPPGTTLFVAPMPLPAGTVHYRVGSDADGWSPTYNLTIPADRWRVAVYGDHGTGEDSEYSLSILPLVAAWQPHLVLHAGDLSYANGDALIWDKWFELVEPVAARSLYMAAPGNHEHEGYYPASGPSPDSAPASGAVLDPYHQFRTRFHFPSPELSYAFDAGPIHVLVLNTEDLCATQPATYLVPWRVSPACDPAAAGTTVAEGVPNQALIDFARADLEAHRDAAWTFVLLHRPAYTSGAYAGERVLQEHFAPLFEANGVDLVLAGHDHNYQRTFPLAAGNATLSDASEYPRGAAPIYVVSGGAGEGLYALEEPAPAWAAFRAQEYHHLRLDVTLTGLRGQAIETGSGEVLDTFTIGDWAPEVAAPGGGPAAGGQGASASAAAALLMALGVAVALRRRS